MRRLMVFNHVSLDGFFTDARGDMSWAHIGSEDPEFTAFTNENASGGGVLVFGRVTYQMMAAYWQSAAAARDMPVVARQMNELGKIVFSRTLDVAEWRNTGLVKGDAGAEMKRIKEEPGADMVIFGSGTLVARLAEARLVDEYQVIVNPIVLGAGRTLFEGMRERLDLELTDSRAFRNGKVFLRYVPAAL